MTNKLLLYIALILNASISFSQEKINSIQKASIQEEIHVLLSKPQPEFATALPLLLKLHDNDPQDLDLNYTLGYCYINLDDERALPYLEFCLKTPQKLPKELLFYSARAFHLEHKFEEAISYYEKFRLTIKKPEKHQSQIDEIYHEERMCENGIELMKKQKNIEVFSFGNKINTEYPEYGPIFDADKAMMIFTSCRPDTKGGGVDNFDGRFFEDIYISRKNDNGEWEEAENIGDIINTDGNDAVVAMSPDGQKIYLYKYANGHGDLYSSFLDGDKWTNPVKLPEPINSNNWEPSLSVSPDENTIYFTSNRPGGFGGTDIYMVRKLPNGEWAEPMNLGESINTEYDEDSPFILADGKTLYFSSNGSKSIGGHDVFLTHFDSEKRVWSKPENLGFPINTAHDDLYFSVSADGETMYFSSIHSEGKGGKDIYYAKIKKETVNVMLAKGHVIDAETKKPILAHIEVIDKNSGEIVGIYNSNELTGNYTIIFQEGIDYKLKISSEGYESHNDNLKIPSLQSFQMITRNFRLLKKDAAIEDFDVKQ